MAPGGWGSAPRKMNKSLKLPIWRSWNRFWVVGFEKSAENYARRRDLPQWNSQNVGGLQFAVGSKSGACSKIAKLPPEWYLQLFTQLRKFGRSILLTKSRFWMFEIWIFVCKCEAIISKTQGYCPRICVVGWILEGTRKKYRFCMLLTVLCR